MLALISQPTPLSPEAGQSHQDEAERPAPWQLALYFRGSDVATVPPIVGKQGFFLTGRYLACLQPLLLASYILRTSRKGAKLKPSYTQPTPLSPEAGQSPQDEAEATGIVEATMPLETRHYDLNPCPCLI